MSVNSGDRKQEKLEVIIAANKAKRGQLAKDKVDEMYDSWRNHASKGNSYRLLKRMDKFYESLWRD